MRIFLLWRGLEAKTLAAFIKYICTQIWSGNTQTVKPARTFGFEEVQREIGLRKVGGGIYDDLTFLFNEEKFKEYLKNTLKTTKRAFFNVFFTVLAKISAKKLEVIYYKLLYYKIIRCFLSAFTDIFSAHIEKFTIIP